MNISKIETKLNNNKLLMVYIGIFLIINIMLSFRTFYSFILTNIFLVNQTAVLLSLTISLICYFLNFALLFVVENKRTVFKLIALQIPILIVIFINLIFIF